MKFAAEVNDNEHCDRDRGDRRQRREEGKNVHRKEHCIKVSLQKIEVIMDYLIPLEFHRASNAEPQPLKLL